MKNRLFWVLILLVMWIVFFVYWTYFYIPSKVEERRLQELERQEIEKNTLPFLEKLDISEENIDIETNQEVIDRLKNDSESYLVKYLWVERFSFEKNSINLDLFLNDKKILSNISFLDKSELNIYEVYGSTKSYHLSIWVENYIYDSLRNKLFTVKISPKVKYVKFDNWDYIIVTDSWSFIYNIQKKNSKYFDYFNDFVFYKDGYLWIVESKDQRRKSNLSIETNNDIIYYYNPNTRVKEKVLDIDFSYKNIYKLDDKIYIKSNDNFIYELKNF